jgi:hypothetical protein
MSLKRARLPAGLCVAALAAAAAFPGIARSRRMARITLMRVPDGAIQPQTIVDHSGVLRMVYLTGDPAAGNVEYTRLAPGSVNFAKPIRVNRQAGSALAICTVRGPQMGVGRNGRAYVVWFGGAAAKPRGPGDGAPVLFSRLNDSGTAFEPQRTVMQFTRGANGGLSVAADRRGDVYVVWHANGQIPGKANRRVFLARSTDDGKTFAREVAISPAALGACGCCGMKAFVDTRGALYVLYRAAGQGIHRDMTLLVSKERGRSFVSEMVYPWLLNACPMSSDDLSEGDGDVLAAWEKAGEVFFDGINPRSIHLSPPVAAPGAATDRKHPAVAANARGQVLLAWTEGTGWLQGGSLAWQLFDSAGQPIGAEGHANGVPVWGMPSAQVDDQGNFTIYY